MFESSLSKRGGTVALCFKVLSFGNFAFIIMAEVVLVSLSMGVSFELINMVGCGCTTWQTLASFVSYLSVLHDSLILQTLWLIDNHC